MERRPLGRHIYCYKERICGGLKAAATLNSLSDGEMAEWSKAHVWSTCVLVRVPWVRLPVSPFKILVLLNKRLPYL